MTDWTTMTDSSPTTNAYLDPEIHVFRCTECGNTMDLCLCPDPARLAHDRLFSATGVFLRSVQQELDAKNSQPDPNNPGAHHLSGLVQEFGNLAQGLRKQQIEGSVSDPAIYKRLVVIASLITFLATEGDPEFNYNPLLTST